VLIILLQGVCQKEIRHLSDRLWQVLDDLSIDYIRKHLCFNFY